MKKPSSGVTIEQSIRSIIRELKTLDVEAERRREDRARRGKKKRQPPKKPKHK